MAADCCRTGAGLSSGGRPQKLSAPIDARRQQPVRRRREAQRRRTRRGRSRRLASRRSAAPRSRRSRRPGSRWWRGSARMRAASGSTTSARPSSVSEKRPSSRRSSPVEARAGGSRRATAGQAAAAPRGRPGARRRRRRSPPDPTCLQARASFPRGCSCLCSQANQVAGASQYRLSKSRHASIAPVGCTSGGMPRLRRNSSGEACDAAAPGSRPKLQVSKRRAGIVVSTQDVDARGGAGR